MKRNGFCGLAALLLGNLSVLAGGGLEEKLEQVIAGRRARVGIAVVIDGRDTVTVNDDSGYPMMSVVKLYQAVAVADELERRGVPLSTRLPVGREALRPDTYSPLRDRFPEGGVELSVAELLEYTLQLSDNNACDLLFAYAGGPEATDSCIRSLGIGDFEVGATEEEMHRDLSLCYRNRTSPLAAVRLVELLATGRILSAENGGFIRRTMTGCGTGLDRLPKPLQGTGAVIGHKTGTSDRDSSGRWIGINDVGFVRLPDGRRYSVAVFVRDSEESAEETGRIIADLSEAVYCHVLGTSGRPAR